MSSYQLKSIDIGYDNLITLRDVSLNIQRGEKVAFLGQSGSGKTSLLSYMINKFNSPEGSPNQPNSCLTDKKTSNTAKVKKQQCVTYISQRLDLIEPLSVFHNIYMGRLNQNPTWYNLVNLLLPQTKEKEYISQLLNTLDMNEKLLTPVKHLSGGQKQRTAIARAICQGGSLLVADEPTTGLDETQTAKLLDLLNHSFETVVVAMHDINLAINHFDRVIGLKDGGVFLNQTTEHLTPEKLLCLYR